jgi:hypothetical protein
MEMPHRCSVTFLILKWETKKVKVKVKQSQYRPGQAVRVPGGWGCQSSRQSVHEGGKVVSPTRWPPLSPQEIFLILISVRGCVDPRAMMRPEGLYQWKIPVTLSGIELTTVGFVAHCLNQTRDHVPRNKQGATLNLQGVFRVKCFSWNKIIFATQKSGYAVRSA